MLKLPMVPRRLAAGRGGIAWCALGLCAWWVCLHSPIAHAHSPPYGVSLLEDEAGEVAVVVTNRGLLTRDPETGRFRLLCIEALGAGSAYPLKAALVGGGRLLVATAQGLQASDDGGCLWVSVEPFAESNVSALLRSPSERDTVYMAIFGDGVSEIHRSRDGGRSFELLHALNETEYVTSLALSASDPDRIYASITDFQAGATAFLLLRSVDAGDSWQEISLVKEEVDYRYVVRAVDPDNPDGLLVSTEAVSPSADPSRLLQSDDAGDTFAMLLEATDITDAGYDVDGRVWATGKNGLYEANRDDGAVESVWDMDNASCGHQSGGLLYVCGYFFAGDDLFGGVGVRGASGVAEGDGAIDKWLVFPEVDQPVSCAADSATAMRCTIPWHDWEVEQLGLVPGPTAPGTMASGTITPDTMAMVPVADAGAPTTSPSMTSATSTQAMGTAMQGSGQDTSGSEMTVASSPPAPGGCNCRLARRIPPRRAGSDQAAWLLAAAIVASLVNRRRRLRMVSKAGGAA